MAFRKSKWPSGRRLVTLSLRFGFLGFFCSNASHGQQWAHGPKTSPKCWYMSWSSPAPNFGTCPGHHLQPIARNLVFEIFQGSNPPPPYKAKHVLFEIIQISKFDLMFDLELLMLLACSKVVLLNTP